MRNALIVSLNAPSISLFALFAWFGLTGYTPMADAGPLRWIALITSAFAMSYLSICVNIFWRPKR